MGLEGPGSGEEGLGLHGSLSSSPPGAFGMGAEGVSPTTSPASIKPLIHQGREGNPTRGRMESTARASATIRPHCRGPVWHLLTLGAGASCFSPALGGLEKEALYSLAPEKRSLTIIWWVRHSSLGHAAEPGELGPG